MTRYQHVAEGVATPAGLGQSRNINGLRWKDPQTDTVAGQWVSEGGGKMTDTKDDGGPFLTAARAETVLRDFERLRQAIRSHDTEAIESAWEKCERWVPWALAARKGE
jgi:hypothetical protein